MPKRTRNTADEAQQETPQKRRSLSRGRHTAPVVEEEITLHTPSAKLTKKQSVTKSTDVELSGKANGKPDVLHDHAGLNDRSARKKSTASLRNSTANELDDEDTAEIALARAILSEDESQDSADEDQVEAGAEPDDELQPDATQPVKRPRGRPKGRRKERTPTPPPDLPAHELYFFHNRTTASHTSANTLPSHALLNHEDYLAQIKAYQDPHEQDIQRLKQLHYRAFEQWQFELEQSYSLCFYGFGSKRALLMEFVDYVHQASGHQPQVVVVNGYNSSIGIKDVLSTVASVLFTDETTLPGQPAALLEAIAKEADKTTSPRIMLVIHNLDSINLRKVSVQAAIAKLASLPRVALLASCDSLNFALMWDLSLLRQYNFVYHDATTFEPWTIELDAVEEVNALLGRSSRRLAGKDGVGYVLRSLPENARSLFKILVTEQLALGDLDFSKHDNGALPARDDDDDDLLGASDEELAARQQNTPSKRGRGRPKKTKTPVKTRTAAPAEGVEYRTLYHKAVEEFVCSSEVNFRTLLKEFHDHQMIESRKDSMGTEKLIVPFRKEELEAILEEL